MALRRRLYALQAADGEAQLKEALHNAQAVGFATQVADDPALNALAAAKGPGRGVDVAALLGSQTRDLRGSLAAVEGGLQLRHAGAEVLDGRVLAPEVARQRRDRRLELEALGRRRAVARRLREGALQLRDASAQGVVARGPPRRANMGCSDRVPLRDCARMPRRDSGVGSWELASE